MLPDFNPCLIHLFEFMEPPYRIVGASLVWQYLYKTNDNWFNLKEMVAMKEMVPAWYAGCHWVRKWRPCFLGFVQLMHKWHSSYSTAYGDSLICCIRVLRTHDSNQVFINGILSRKSRIIQSSAVVFQYRIKRHNDHGTSPVCGKFTGVQKYVKRSLTAVCNYLYWMFIDLACLTRQRCANI